MRTFAVAALASAVCLCTLPAASQKLHTLHVKPEAGLQQFFRYAPHATPIISGHRGGSEPGYPENTVAIFTHTLSITPAMFETDPRLTKDGQLIMIHDPELGRTIEKPADGTGKVIDYTVAQLQAMKMKDSTGAIVPGTPPTLDQMIAWARGKTILNLDIKDSPAQQRLDAVKKADAFSYVLFTVHNAKEAKWFYEADHRSMFAAVLFNQKQIDAFEAAGIPWDHIAIGYVGATSKPENAALYKTLHEHGIKVMVATGPSYDKLPAAEERAKMYRQVFEDGADILETDRPVEAAAAIKGMKTK